MVFESRAGEVFVLGASSWRIIEITRDRVLVVPAPGEPGKMPFWKARPRRAARRARPRHRPAHPRAAAPMPRTQALRRLREEHALDERAAENLLAYLDEQKEATGALPDDRTLVLERTRDEMGDWRLCLLSPWGGRVHAPWAMALEARLRERGRRRGRRRSGATTASWCACPTASAPPDAAALLPEPDEIEDLVVRELGGTAPLRRALPRGRGPRAAPAAAPARPALAALDAAEARGRPAEGGRRAIRSFPIILEAYRECLQDVFDLPGFVDLARRVRRRELRLVTVDTQAPSPFAASLLFGYVANYLYDGDAPLAERRAQALSVDQAQLRELLGEAELRELLDARGPRRAGAAAAGPGPVPPRAQPRPPARPAAAPRRPDARRRRRRGSRRPRADRRRRRRGSGWRRLRARAAGDPRS